MNSTGTKVFSAGANRTVVVVKPESIVHELHRAVEIIEGTTKSLYIAGHFLEAADRSNREAKRVVQDALRKIEG